MKRHRYTGFTLIELVVVIILIAIVSMYASSRYFGKNSVDVQLVQSELLASLRLTQLRAMHRNGYCNRWRVDGAEAGDVSLPNTEELCSTALIKDSSYVNAGEKGITLALSTNTGTSFIDFDSLGKPQQCANTSCTLTMQSSLGVSRTICINSQGGIYACD